MNTPEEHEGTEGGALASNDQLGAWQPIETAPQDGTDVLVCRTYPHSCAEYAVAHNYGDGSGWRDMGDIGLAGMTVDDDNQPTHWMPLPAPPQSA